MELKEKERGEGGGGGGGGGGVRCAPLRGQNGEAVMLTP